MVKIAIQNKWNKAGIFVCGCYKKCEIDEYFNNCTGIKHPIDYLEIICEDQGLNNTTINTCSENICFLSFFSFYC